MRTTSVPSAVVCVGAAFSLSLPHNMVIDPPPSPGRSVAGPHPARRLLAAPAALDGKAQCVHLGASVVLFLKLTFSLPVHLHSDVACHMGLLHRGGFLCKLSSHSQWSCVPYSATRWPMPHELVETSAPARYPAITSHRAGSSSWRLVFSPSLSSAIGATFIFLHVAAFRWPNPIRWAKQLTIGQTSMMPRGVSHPLRMLSHEHRAITRLFSLPDGSRGSSKRQGDKISDSKPHPAHRLGLFLLLNIASLFVRFARLELRLRRARRAM
ncbi:hypothetical protein BT67DRAFT_14160 [Trichocladium antarcticum]|uniref:Uncharacterized protein n=1 Tax=Trichocladium antarcticum TaxID=1450529 RepID=A0AAN6ZHY5_9PEZI|nr:hypothetical protein BT67DRAFT_14160 [Trichocladium antarcticum]